MGAIANDWLVPLSAEFKKPYYASLYKKGEPTPRIV